MVESMISSDQSIPSSPLPARAELKSRRPSNDGGVKKDRHKGGKFNKEGLMRATAAIRDRVVEFCIMHKEEGKSHSEADYEVRCAPRGEYSGGQGTVRSTRLHTCYPGHPRVFCWNTVGKHDDSLEKVCRAGCCSGSR